MGYSLRLKIVRIFLGGTGLFLLFWWPLSHWFYPDTYHQLLGFEAGSYQDNMVKVIGTTGLVPVLLLFFSAADPVRNRHMVMILIAFSALMAMTYVYLITSGQFPVLEFTNVGLSVFTALFLTLLYPWRGDISAEATGVPAGP